MTSVPTIRWRQALRPRPIMDKQNSKRPPWTEVRFRRCVLNRAGRELRRDGQVQALEPRAFDVLVYLIDHRHRVSSKADIRHSCFRDAPVGDGALARTVMKARRAIADLDETLPLIKTVHRVGYRFVGSVETGAAVAEPPPRPYPRDGASRRLALMPFVNETEDAELAWVELGLMSLVAHALRSDPEVSVVPVQDV